MANDDDKNYYMEICTNLFANEMNIYMGNMCWISADLCNFVYFVKQEYKIQKKMSIQKQHPKKYCSEKFTAFTAANE